MTQPMAFVCFVIVGAFLVWALGASIINWIERERVRRMIEKELRKMDKEKWKQTEQEVKISQKVVDEILFGDVDPKVGKRKD